MAPRLSEHQEPSFENRPVADSDNLHGGKAVSYSGLPNKGQLAVLCLARMADPLAQTSIESYVFYQLKSFDPSASDAAISSQAGLLMSVRTMAQVCTGIPWGRVADSERGGRKTVLLTGLTSCCISYIGFGLSKSFISALAWQCFGGAMSSNVAVTRCMVAELNPDKRYRARALLLLPLFANVGNLVGPLVGGLLSSNRIDGPIANFAFLGPNLFLAAIYLFAAIVVFLFLKETLEHTSQSGSRGSWWRGLSIAWVFSANRNNVQVNDVVDNGEPGSRGDPSQEPLLGNTQRPKAKRKLPFHRIWTVNVIFTMLSQFIIIGHIGTFPILWAIFLSTPQGDLQAQRGPFKFNGGLGLRPREVGFAMSLLGAIGVLLQLVVYPIFQDRFGTISIWRNALLIFPLVYLTAPYPSLMASATSFHKHTVTGLVWLSVGFVVFLFIAGKTGVTPATTLLINDSTPHPSVRGTIHAAATVTANLSRSIFPVVALAIFGQGLRIGVVGLGFWVLSGLALFAYATSLWVMEGTNGGEIVLDDSDSDDGG